MFLPGRRNCPETLFYDNHSKQCSMFYFLRIWGKFDVMVPPAAKSQLSCVLLYFHLSHPTIIT